MKRLRMHDVTTALSICSVCLLLLTVTIFLTFDTDNQKEEIRKYIYFKDLDNAKFGLAHVNLEENERKLLEAYILLEEGKRENSFLGTPFNEESAILVLAIRDQKSEFLPKEWVNFYDSLEQFKTDLSIERLHPPFVESPLLKKWVDRRWSSSFLWMKQLERKMHLGELEEARLALEKLLSEDLSSKDHSLVNRLLGESYLLEAETMSEENRTSYREQANYYFEKN